ncbi:MAG: hypothetical protein ACTSWA_06330 [Candidatus Thorarchaeota archaeon]
MFGIKRRILLAVVFVTTLLISYYGLFQNVFIFLLEMQHSYIPSLPLVWVLIIIAGFILLMIPSLVTSSLDEVLEKKTVDSNNQVTRDIYTLRKEFMGNIDAQKLVSLDEYWEIVIVIITISVLIFSLLETSIAHLADWTQVSITLIFWASYKFGKAKHSIDLRLLSIAAITQFLTVILSIYAMAWSVEFLVTQWIRAGSPIHPLLLLNQNAAGGWVLILYSIIIVCCIIIYYSKDLAGFVSLRCWRYLLISDTTGDVIDTEALYLANYALPPYLFYGCVWFLALIIPFPSAGGESLFILLITTVVVLCLVTLGWLFNVWRAQYRVLDRSPGLLLRIVIKAGSYSKDVVAFVAGGVTFGLILILAPLFTFGFPLEVIGIANAINGALILFVVQGASSSSKKDKLQPSKSYRTKER